MESYKRHGKASHGVAGQEMDHWHIHGRIGVVDECFEALARIRVPDATAIGTRDHARQHTRDRGRIEQGAPSSNAPDSVVATRHQQRSVSIEVNV